MSERIKIAELERLDRAAKPGPWKWWQAEKLTNDLDPTAGLNEYELICAMRCALPALLRLARAAKADRDIAARLVRGEYSDDLKRYYKDRNPILREVEEALEAFDWN